MLGAGREKTSRVRLFGMGAEVNRKFGLQWFKRRDLLGLMEAAQWMRSKRKQREGKATARN